MFDVNIYIETDCKSPKKRGGKFGYVLEYKTKAGTEYTRAAGGKVPGASGKRLALIAVREAIGRIGKKSRVTVYTDCAYIGCAFKNEWLDRWKENAWHRSSHREVKNKDIWEEISKELELHQVSVIVAPRHTYSAVLLAELKKTDIPDGEIKELETLGTGRRETDNGKTARHA